MIPAQFRLSSSCSSSEEDLTEDYIYIVRGSRPSRRRIRRTNSPENLRPPRKDDTEISISSNESSEEEVSGYEVSSSAPNPFLFVFYSLRNVLYSRRRPSDTAATPSQIHQDTPEGPSASSRPSILETIAGKTPNIGIRQAADKNNEGDRKNRKSGASGASKSNRNSGANGSGSARQSTAAPSAAARSSVTPSNARASRSRLEEPEVTEKRKKTADKMERIKSKMLDIDKGDWLIPLSRPQSNRISTQSQEPSQEDASPSNNSTPPPPADVHKSPKKSAPPHSPRDTLQVTITPPTSPLPQPQPVIIPVDPPKPHDAISPVPSAPEIPINNSTSTVTVVTIASSPEIATDADDNKETRIAAEVTSSQEKSPLGNLSRLFSALSSASSALTEFLFIAIMKLTEDKPEEVVEENFDDGVQISSDEEDNNLSTNGDDDDGDDQMDSEWLDLSDEDIRRDDYYDDDNQREEEMESSRGDQLDQLKETSIDSETQLMNQKDEPTQPIPEKSENPRVRIPGHQFALKHLHQVLPIYKTMLFLGRFPFEIDLSAGVPQFKLNKTSWRYFLFLKTSLLTFLGVVLMVANLLRIARTQEPYTFHETILRLEQDKYWIEAILEVLNMTFVAVSSVCLLECCGGIFIVDFLNRWFCALSIIRYDVSPGIRKLVYTFFVGYILYAVVFIGLFFLGGDEIPTIRGMCGFVGILTLNFFMTEIRLRSYFEVIEYFGLFVHLYTMMARSLITLFISVHCLTADNAARRFNHRLGGCLRGVDFRLPVTPPSASADNKNATAAHLRKTVPYSKLFAECLVVTSFPRQIGKVFSIAFFVYLSCKLGEMIVTIFGVGEPLVNGFPVSNETYFNVSAQSTFDPDKVVPILIVEPVHVVSMKCYLYMLKTWAPWLVFMEIVRQPGTSVLRGASLLVRKSYLHCKNKHALRFLTSMKFSFGSRVVFGVGPGVEITRSFIVKFVGLAIAIFLTMMQFIPSLTNGQGVLVCDHLGGCFYFEFPAKLRSHHALRLASRDDLLDLGPKPPRPLIKLLEKKEFELSFPPCNHLGRLPNEPSTFAFRCVNGKQNVYIPTYFGSRNNKFAQVQPDAGDHSCGSKSLELSKFKELFDCYGKHVGKLDIVFDECGNPKLETPDEDGKKKLPNLRAVRFESGEIFCCYDYGALLKEQGKQCNLFSTESGEPHCKRNPNSHPQRQKHENSISKIWKEAGALEEQQRLWTECLCQGIDESISSDPSACDNGKTPKPVPPITPPPVTGSGFCLDVIPADKSCSNSNADIQIYNEFYLHKCPEPVTHSLPTVLQFKRDSQNGQVVAVPFKYPCEKQTTLVGNSPSISGLFYDCYGGFTFIQRNRGWNVDDCGTRKLPFPSGQENGKKKWPVAKVVKLEEKPGTSGSFSYMCCWNYEELQDGRLNSKCNLYPGSDHSSVCSLRKASSDSEAKEVCENVSSYKYFIQSDHYNELYVETCMDFDSSSNKPVNKCKN